MTDDIIPWLHQQIDTDEAQAKAATRGPWRVNEDKYGAATVDGPDVLQDGGHDPETGGRRQVMRPLVVIPPDVDYGAVVDMGDAEHIVRYDPVWALARVEVMRAVLAMYETQRRLREENAQTLAKMGRSPRWSDPKWGAKVGSLRTFGWELEGRVSALQMVIRQNAVEYADRPGYQESWRP